VTGCRFAQVLAYDAFQGHALLRGRRQQSLESSLNSFGEFCYSAYEPQGRGSAGQIAFGRRLTFDDGTKECEFCSVAERLAGEVGWRRDGVVGPTDLLRPLSFFCAARRCARAATVLRLVASASQTATGSLLPFASTADLEVLLAAHPITDR
jgi:hypothetical protein